MKELLTSSYKWGMASGEEQFKFSYYITKMYLLLFIIAVNAILHGLKLISK